MELRLKKDELFDLSRGFGRGRVVCHKGRCWLTREGDSRDLILSCGSESTVDGRSVMVMALSDVHLQLIA